MGQYRRLKMAISQLIKQHPSMAWASEMAQVCKPLKSLGVTYFGHARIDKDGRLATNANHPTFLEHYYKHGYYNYDFHMGEQTKSQRYFLWDIVPRFGQTEILYNVAIEFGFSHTFTIIERENDEKNCYHFATKAGNTFMNDFYLQHIDLLEKFVSYFKDQLLINDRLNRAYQSICRVSTGKDGNYFIENNFPLTLDPENLSEYLKAIDSTSTTGVNPADTIHLTRREQQCAHYLLEGHTSKEIADQLHISARTVEVYFERLKKRFGSKNKIQLARHLVEQAKGQVVTSDQ